MLKKMTPGNFNWLLHVMLFYHTLQVIRRQEIPAGNEEEMDDSDSYDEED